MENDNYRFALLSDMQIIRSELDEEAWIRLSRLLEFSCTKPEWILLGFAAGTLSRTLVLAAPHRFNVPLEIIRLHGGSDESRFISTFPIGDREGPNPRGSRTLLHRSGGFP